MTIDDLYALFVQQHAEQMEMYYRIYFAEWWIIGLLSLVVGILLCRIVLLRSIV